MQCARYFTVASTADNDLVFWGTRFKTPPAPPEADSGWGREGVNRQHSRAPSTASAGSLTSNKEEGAQNTGDGMYRDISLEILSVYCSYFLISLQFICNIVLTCQFSNISFSSASTLFRVSYFEKVFLF